MKNLTSDKERDSDMAAFEMAYHSVSNNSHDEYQKFSSWVHDIFIPKGEILIDIGNFQTCNEELMPLVERKIRKHPWIWRIFFMV